MNNYCTNCGNKLKTYTVVCDKCNTPVADISYEYKHISLMKRFTKRRITIVLLIVISVIFTFFVARKFYISHMSKKLMNEMVIPFLEERYGSFYRDVEFDLFGKCIIDGNCYTEPLIECDGNGCEVYTYLNRFKCMSFYYKYKIGEEEFELSVFKEKGEYKVVNGRNIYGYDDVFSDNYSNKDEYDYKSIFIKDSNYESDFLLRYDKLDYEFYIQDKGSLSLSCHGDSGLSGSMVTYSDELLVKIDLYNELYEYVNTIVMKNSEYDEKYYHFNDNGINEYYMYYKVIVGENHE